MFCTKCGNNVVKCTCGDIEERLQSLRGVPGLDQTTIVDLPLVIISENKFREEVIQRLQQKEIYIKTREALIPIAELHANKIAGIRSLVKGPNNRRIREEWYDKWNFAFHSKMEELYKESKNIVH
jgi:hypothetical protein